MHPQPNYNHKGGQLCASQAGRQVSMIFEVSRITLSVMRTRTSESVIKTTEPVEVRREGSGALLTKKEAW